MDDHERLSRLRMRVRRQDAQIRHLLKLPLQLSSVENQRVSELLESSIGSAEQYVDDGDEKWVRCIARANELLIALLTNAVDWDEYRDPVDRAREGRVAWVCVRPRARERGSCSSRRSSRRALVRASESPPGEPPGPCICSVDRTDRGSR